MTTVRRAAIGLADWLQAMRQLGLRDGESAAAVARLLGLADDTAAAAPAMPRAPVLQPPLPPLPPVPAPPALPPSPVADRTAAPALWRGGALRLEALPPAPPPPVPAFTQPALAAAGPPVAAPLPPLLDPGTARALLVALASAPAPSGEIDIDRLAALLARGRVPRRLPERWRRSLRGGVQVLVDAAPGMEPFEHDARQLVAALRRLLPPPQVQAGHWLGGADLACWMDGAPRATRWQPPPPGGVLLLVTEFSRGGWAPLARAAAAQGVPLRALVPRPPAEWPAAARRHLQPVHWERTLTVAALRPGAVPAAPPLDPAARAQRVLHLAALASLAVRVDPPLLRRLRLRVPGADAGTEAALWASEWIESRGVEGFVLDGAELPALRAQLVAMPGALDIAWHETQAAHARWPASLQLEERLTWLALAGGAVDWDAEWEPVLAAIAAGDERAKEVARWAARAVPRLPPAAREADAARAVLLASAVRIGGAARTLAGSMPGPAHAWLLAAPPATTEWTVEGAGPALLLRPRAPADPPERVLRLPATRPPLLELAWQEGGTPQRRLCPVQAGQPLPLPEGAQGVELRALGGAGWRVLALGPAAAPDDRWRAWHTLIFNGGQIAMGALVFPGYVLTVTLPSTNRSQPKLDEVRIGEHRIREVRADIVEDIDSGLALLAVPSAPTLRPVDITEALPAPEGNPVFVAAWAEGPGAYLDHFQAQAVEPGRLRLNASELQPTRGAPLIVDGRLAGIALGGDDAADGYAIRRFMAWALRPPEHWPAVKLALPRGDATWMYDAVRPLLESLRLRESRGPDDLPPEAALIAFPDKPDAQSREQELDVALRGWADPLFGIVIAGDAEPALKFFDGMPRHDVQQPNFRAVLHEAVDGPTRRLHRPPTPEHISDDLRLLVGRLRLKDPVVPAGKVSTAAAVEHCLSIGDRALAKRILDLATQDMLTDGAWLQSVVNIRPDVPVAMGIVSVVLARLALAAAFYPLLPWRSVELRQPVTSVEQIRDAVAEIASQQIGADAGRVAKAMSQSRAPVFVLLMNPLPPADMLQAANRLLPGARFIGLTRPGEAPRGYEPLGLDLPEGGLHLLMQFYKPLAELIDPRPSRAQGKAPRPKLSKQQEPRR